MMIDIKHSQLIMKARSYREADANSGHIIYDVEKLGNKIIRRSFEEEINNND